MSALTTAEDQLLKAIAELRAQMDALNARLARLEERHEPAAEAAPAAVPEAAASREPELQEQQEEEITPELMMVISAAVAAFLGERGHIRAVRLVSTNRWAQQGRVNIQASHRLSRT